MRKAKRRAPDVVAPVVMLAVMLLAWPARALALDSARGLGQYQHAAWTAREGLMGSVRAIVQTPDGYLWLGTEFGLVRFDGVRFLRWPQGPDQQLPSPRILSLLAARDGTLWIGTFGGLASWKDGRLTRYREIEDQMDSLLEDHEGTIWAGTNQRVCAIRSGRFECRGDVKSSGPSTYGYLQGGVFSLHEDTQHRLWVGAESGLWQWQPVPPRRVLAQPVAIFGAVVQGDRPTTLTVITGSPRGRELREIADDKQEIYAVPGAPRTFTPNRLMRDRRSALWIGTLDQGLLHVDHGKTTRFAQSDGLSSDFVLAFFEDREGNIWVGTTNGLDRFRTSVVSTISASQGLSVPAWSVASSHDGSIWIGTDDGVNRWQDGQLTAYRSAQLSRAGRRTAGYGTVREVTDPGLPDNIIGPLTEDTHGRMWVVTRGGAAWFENGRFTRAGSLTAGASTAIAADTREGVWIADPDRGLVHLVAGRAVDSISWPWSRAEHDRRVSAILPDPIKGGLWLGFLYGGIAYFEHGKLATSLGKKDGLGADLVWSLFLDRGGALWAATDGGLSGVKGGRVATLTTRNGLPCDVVRMVREDDASSLWLYTACGLVRIAPFELDAWWSDSKRTVQTTVFDSADGVRSSAVVGRYGPRATKSPDGKLWFAHGDGVSVVDPRHLTFNTLPPPVRIELVTADGRTYDTSQRLSLPPLVRDLSIDYTALSFVAPEKNRFRVKLEGWDRDWKDVGNRRQAFYNNLPPRNFRFRVIASNNSGVWNEAGDSFDFSIAPAYYQTRWFQASCAAAFLALLWALYRFRLHQIAREFNANLEGRVDERLRVARELHDTLLQSFHGLLMRFQAAHNLLPGRVADAREVLETALDDAAKAITEARDAVQDLRSSAMIEDDLAKAIETAGKELAAHQRDGNRDAAGFSVEVEGASQHLHPIMRDEIYRITNEALRNAFRHAGARRIEVEIRYDARGLRVRVRDDGTGIDASLLGQEGCPGHFGLAGMRERAKRIGGQLEVWSERGAGTEVELTVPASVAYGARGGWRLFRGKEGTNS
ncbi:MAG TPA: two-component regulator propeller domain-containing protein [Bryobacteraceae bacterium]|nr:two-component regulator propeller domain-containing protein [Bryobacteraceae bacterium]